MNCILDNNPNIAPTKTPEAINGIQTNTISPQNPHLLIISRFSLAPPDIIFVDYLNICASARYKNAVVNSYTFIKSIAEELRGLAVECNVPIVSATQTTRSGYGNSDVEITDTSESFGLPATADLMVALISTEDMEAAGQIMVKQLKNRYNDPTMNKRFVVGIDRAKMRLYDCDQSAQDNIIDSGQDIDDNSIETKSTSKVDSWQV